ncbi:hypothetical protein EDD15DRAFT_1119497 [Pisolithus albus]|nr:hypothetical protein EDD15DRAFT_1119497 [Pisolithus albus]
MGYDISLLEGGQPQHSQYIQGLSGPETSTPPAAPLHPVRQGPQVLASAENAPKEQFVDASKPRTSFWRSRRGIITIIGIIVVVIGAVVGGAVGATTKTTPSRATPSSSTPSSSVDGSTGENSLLTSSTITASMTTINPNQLMTPQIAPNGGTTIAASPTAFRG